MRRTWALATLALLVVGLTAVLVLPGPWAAGKPDRTVYLRATFRDANNELGQPLDKMRSDGKGAYVNAPYITALINSAGELQFEIDSRSGRRGIFIFDDLIVPGTAQELPPDTACNPGDGIPDEPATLAWYLTHVNTAYEMPQVNLLTMSPGQTAEITLWIGFDTDVRPLAFYLKFARDFNPLNPTRKASFVIVRAEDKDLDGTVDRWVFYPKPGTDDSANLHRLKVLSAKKDVYYDYGNYRMPFELYLDRL